MIELLDVAQMAEADRLTIAAGLPGFDLMMRAGVAVAARARQMADGGPVAVVAGPGNNGGDGFIAAALLEEAGLAVSVHLLGSRDALKGDAAMAAKAWRGDVRPFDATALDSLALIVDALFGAGLKRPIDGEAAAMIEAINASNAKVLSVDLPSGIHGDNGTVMGSAVNADRTVTFFRKKPGHLLLPGLVHCGGVEVADIGVADSVLDAIAPRAFENVPLLWLHHFPIPKIDGHKYDRGHVAVLSGSVTSSGAARLAARGALRVGAGLVTVASPEDALAVNASALTAIMVREAGTASDWSKLLSDKRFNVCVIGPGNGVGERTRNCVLAALDAKRAAVFDADALMSFAQDSGTLFRAIKGADAHAILTPHDGEFARLFPSIAKDKSKLERAREAAQMSGAVVLLKGADTVVASLDGRASIAANAPRWLGTAGAGDVLAGIIGGLLAQHVPAFEAASIGVWLHGEAARAFGPGLIAEDLSEALPQVIREMYRARGFEFNRR